VYGGASSEIACSIAVIKAADAIGKHFSAVLKIHYHAGTHTYISMCVYLCTHTYVRILMYVCVCACTCVSVAVLAYAHHIHTDYVNSPGSFDANCLQYCYMHTTLLSYDVTAYSECILASQSR
jgi:hypothetical protein